MTVETWTDDDGVAYVSCSPLRQGDYCGSSYCEANIRALEDTDGAYVQRGQYYSRQLWLPDTEDNRETCRFLSEDYPVWDDEAVSEVEMEWEEAAWNDYGACDLAREMKRGGGGENYRPMMGEALEYLSDDDAWRIYRDSMEATNSYPAYEDAGASLPLERIAGEYADRAARCLANEWIGTTRDGADVVSAAILEYVNVVSEGVFFSTSDDGAMVHDKGECGVAADWCQDNAQPECAAFLLALHNRECVVG